MYLYLLIMSSIGRLPIEIRYYQQVYILIISINGGHGYHITCCSNKIRERGSRLELTLEIMVLL